MEKEHKKSKKKTSLIIILSIVIVLIVSVCIAGMIFFYFKYQDLKNSPDVVAKQEVTVLVSDIGKLMVLPTDEQPTVATVTDKDKLSNQIFFKDTQNGDKLLAYTVAKKAILYRPSTKKIINIAPFNIDASTQTTKTN